MPVAKKLTPDKSRNLTGISILPAICDEIKNVVTFSRLMWANIKRILEMNLSTFAKKKTDKERHGIGKAIRHWIVGQ